jgi:hypothetical protein
LFVLPDINKKNIFENNYYGNIATTRATILKLAKTEIHETLWYYIFLDFTGDEPSDGGGPYYYGWIQDEYLSDI